MAIIGAVASFAPILFPYKWEQVSEEQKNYKKKIFGPISFNSTLLQAPGTFNQVTPGVLLSTRF
jgi:hypothetical protein